MEKPIFQIAQKQYTGESAVISIRLPKDMLADLDEAARISGRTRNEILTMSLEFSMNHRSRKSFRRERMPERSKQTVAILMRKTERKRGTTYGDHQV